MIATTMPITTPATADGTTPQAGEQVITPAEDALHRIAALDARRQRLVEPEREAIRGIFDDETSLFTKYRITLRFTGWVLGGTPRRVDIVEKWLRTKTGVDDSDELRAMLVRTLEDMGAEVSEDMSYDEIVEASKRLAGDLMANGFKRDGTGLYLEARQLKAALKESANIVFGGNRERWGVSKKGPKHAVAEWVFVEQERIHLRNTDGTPKAEPDGMHLFIGHVNGPQGPRSTLTYYEYCDRPTITYDVFSLQDRVTLDQWKQLLVHGQENGIGAVRSQGFGKFKVISFEKLG